MPVQEVLRSRVRLVRIAGHETEVIEARFGTSGFARHFHDTYSFGLVLRGVNRFGYRRRTFEAPAGTIGICDPGEVHDGGRANREWAYRSIFPTVGTMAALAEDLGMDGAPGFAMGHIEDPLSVSRMARLMETVFSGASDFEVEEAAIDALATAIRRNASGVRPRHRPVVSADLASRALGVIHDRWSDRLTLDEIARETGSDRFSVIRAVSKATGLTPHAYLVQVRVAHARRLIRSGVPLAQVAADTGFVDQSHLTRCVTQRWGVAPGAFQRARGLRRPR